MKKILTLLGVVGLAVAANAQKYTQDSFLVSPYVIITNNSTVFFGATNVVYANPQNFYEVLSFGTNYNSGTITNGAVINGTPYATNYNPYVVGQLVPPNAGIYPLLSLTNHPSTTNAPIFGPAWTDAMAFADRNGNVPTSAAIHIVLNCDPYQQSSGGPTNTAAFEFRKIVGFLNVPGQSQPKYPLVATDVSGNDIITLQLQIGGQTNFVASTNLTAGQMAGAYGWRMTKVVSGNSTTNGSGTIAFMLYDVSLDSWVP